MVRFIVCDWNTAINLDSIHEIYIKESLRRDNGKDLIKWDVIAILKNGEKEIIEKGCFYEKGSESAQKSFSWAEKAFRKLLKETNSIDLIELIPAEEEENGSNI